MKLTHLFSYVVVAAIACISCSETKEGQDAQKPVSFFSAMDKFATRTNTAGDQWVVGDEIGVFMTQSGGSLVVGSAKNIAYTAQSSSQTTSFSAAVGSQAIYYPSNADTVDFIAYYPYNSAANDYIYPIVLSNQSAGIASHDLLYARSNRHTESSVQGVAFTFKHQLSRLCVKTVLADGLGSIQSVSISGINTTANFDLTNMSIEDEAQGQIAPYYRTADDTYMAIMLPALLSGSEIMTFMIDGVAYEWILKNNANNISELKMNTSYTFEVTISKSDVTSTLVEVGSGSVSPWEDDENSTGTADKATVTLPEPTYINDFETADGVTIVGDGDFVDSGDSRFGQVFQNATGGTRTNYLLLPTDILSHAVDTKELSIGVWVNASSAGASADYAWSPLFTAHSAAPTGEGNTWPMFALQYRGVMQVNCSGYSDFEDTLNSSQSNSLLHYEADWLSDGEWHYYTVTLTSTIARIYIDGTLINEWVLDDNTEGQVVSGLFIDGNVLTYNALGGNQAWDYADNDPGFAFDDFVVYNQALSISQIAAIIARK